MPSLSKREREIMDLLAQGLTGEEVADRLVLSSETVKTHIRNAMTKLEARNRVARRSPSRCARARSSGPEGSDACSDERADERRRSTDWSTTLRSHRLRHDAARRRCCR